MKKLPFDVQLFIPPPPQIIKNKYTPQTQTQPDMKEEKI